LFAELGMPNAQELHVPLKDVSVFIFRDDDVFLLVLFHEAVLPSWYCRVIRGILKEVSDNQNAR